MQPKRPRFNPLVLALALAAVLMIWSMLGTSTSSASSSMTYSTVVNYFEHLQVTEFALDRNTGVITMKIKEGDLPLPGETDQSTTESTGGLLSGMLAPSQTGDVVQEEEDGTVTVRYQLPYAAMFVEKIKEVGVEELNAPKDWYVIRKKIEVKDEEGDYEKDLPWYRWEAEIPVATLSNLAGLNLGKDLGTLLNVEVTETGPGGVVLQICLTGEKDTATVETENKIRKALGGSGYRIRKQDGTETDSGSLLPSAFFTIENSGDRFLIHGGGYGHGIGMSQNGANEMAKKGKTYVEILQMFYSGVSIGDGEF